jgi:hypothetical protein
VRPGDKVERRRTAPGAQQPISRGVAIGHLVYREIGQRKSAFVQHRLDFTELHIEGANLLTRLLQALHQIIGRLLGALASRYFITGSIPLGLQRLNPGQ